MLTFSWRPTGPSQAPAQIAWAVVYGTVDSDFRAALRGLAARYPKAVIFGTTSHQGVLGPHGFDAAVRVLAADQPDDPRVSVVSRSTTPARARADARAAAEELAAMCKAADGPVTILLHATPGFEESILEGIREGFGGVAPPVYGGSAANEHGVLPGVVFANGRIEEQGFVLAAFTSPRPIHGAFVAGYVATRTKGIVTSAQGRVVHTIDGRPAAKVYDEWTGGAIRDLLDRGGNALQRTVLQPIGRVVDKVGAMPRYVLSHPLEVFANGSMSFFTEFAVGNEITVMMGNADALVERSTQAAARARRDAGPLRGALFVYCAGYLGAVGTRSGEVGKRLGQFLGNIPFVGAATFGEQGCFIGKTSVNRHGNLMCDAILFE